MKRTSASTARPARSATSSGECAQNGAQLVTAQLPVEWSSPSNQLSAAMGGVCGSASASTSRSAGASISTALGRSRVISASTSRAHAGLW